MANIISVDEYMSFVMAMLLAVGVAFLVPLGIVMLNLAGVLTHERFRTWRRMMIFAVFLIAGMANPSPDPISMLILGGACAALVEAAECLVWSHDRRRARAHPTPTPAWPPTSSPSSDSTTPTPPAGSPDGPAARARQRLGRLNGDFGDVADVAAVLGRRGDQFAQPPISMMASWRDGGATPAARNFGVSLRFWMSATKASSHSRCRWRASEPSEGRSRIQLSVRARSDCATAIQAWIACRTWASHGARGSTAAAIWRTVAVLAC